MLNTFAKVLNDIFRQILFEHGLVKSQNKTKNTDLLKNVWKYQKRYCKQLSMSQET